MNGIEGKTCSIIAKEYHVTHGCVAQWAKKNDVPSIELDGKIICYIFDKEAEEKFKNRPKAGRRWPVKPPSPPKVPGKPGRPKKEKPLDSAPKRSPGRPRKEKPVDAEIKRPRGRPRKYPMADVMLTPRPRGRPRKEQ